MDERDPCQLSIASPNERTGTKMFRFDHVFDSHSIAASNYSSQREVFEVLGLEICESASQGFNTSLFAYGQVWPPSCLNFTSFDFLSQNATLVA